MKKPIENKLKKGVKIYALVAGVVVVVEVVVIVVVDVVGCKVDVKRGLSKVYAKNYNVGFVIERTQ